MAFFGQRRLSYNFCLFKKEVFALNMKLKATEDSINNQPAIPHISVAV